MKKLSLKSEIKEHWLKGVVLLCSLLVIYLTTFAKLDTIAKSRIDSSFKQALGVFATAKALNGIISVVQGTEVGVFVTVSIGEILDPINDLVERFSWVMLASLTSLGIQKILMNMVVFKGFEILLILSLVVTNILLFFKQKKYEQSRNLFFKFTILLIFLRFSIPFMAMSNEYIYLNFIKNDYNIKASQQIVDLTKVKINQLNKKESSIFSSNYYKQKKIELEKLSNMVGRHIVDLIIVFIFQTMLFPILFLWFLYRMLIAFLRSFHNP